MSRMADESRPHGNNNPVRTSGLVSWAIYDWANSAFITIIQSFIFSAYFTRRIAISEDAGSTQWGTAVGAAGLLVAVCGPVLGAIADQTGRRKPWIFSFSRFKTLFRQNTYS